MPDRLEIIEPHGFCMGVSAAVNAASRALSFIRSGNSASQVVYCLHELVHNACVIDELKAEGMRFIESLDEIPDGGKATVLFSAHGVSPHVRIEAARRGLDVIDATCPFVARIHRQVQTFAENGKVVIVIGHSEHVEVRGVMEEARAAGAEVRVVLTSDDAGKLDFLPSTEIGIVCQTTLSAAEAKLVTDALCARYGRAETPAAADVCTATRKRQDAVRKFVGRGGDGVLVLGSANSSNTRRLAEIAAQCGAKVRQIASLQELETCDFSGIKCLGVTSGASTPESFFNDAVAVLRKKNQRLGVSLASDRLQLTNKPLLRFQGK